MELAKCILFTFEILLSTWINYRSGRIVLNKGDTDDSSSFLLMEISGIWLATTLWKITFSSWVLMYSSAIYLLIYLIYIIKSPPILKVISAVAWIGFVIVLPFYL